jgi:hypothetical protein
MSALTVFCNLPMSRTAKSKTNTAVFVCTGYEENKKDLGFWASFLDLLLMFII